MRQEVTIELHESQNEYLNEMIASYGIKGLGKALRCLVDFSIERKDLEEDIFKTKRCLNCKKD
ncbi:MAG: hypothetical protein OXE78_09965 [Gammaproteobacteria bacterium]|nr:hypothetical protein [Gammaproteobacteria bacterium]MCY4356235.1 hypothetical protein [Gammaproteobacteria bacterium]